MTLTQLRQKFPQASQSFIEANCHENNPASEVSHSQPQRDQAPALEPAVPRKEKGLGRVRVRFIGYRVRPLDPDGFAASVKDCLDFLRHARLIDGDEPWRIVLETEQVRVAHFKDEFTQIEIDDTACQ